MGMTYFRRYHMEMDLSKATTDARVDERLRELGYEWVPFDEGLIREHAQAKFHSFRNEMDADVFPCLGRRDGCLRLMREICSRTTFIAGATWLLRFRERPGGRAMPVGTVQGIEHSQSGSIQNLGVVPEHRGRGLGQQLMLRAAIGFYHAGLRRMNLEVTTMNTSAVRLYEKIGFEKAKVVYKACDIVGI